MKFTPRAFLTVSLLVICALGIWEDASAQRRKTPVRSPLVITPPMLRPHLRFLSSDELEGRETTKRGQKVAAQYLASEFERIGLAPAGDNGTYLQRFYLYQSKIGDKSSIAMSRGVQRAVTQSLGKDFYFMVGGADTVSAPLLFAGYGIDDTARFGYSDYQGISAAGKIVLCMAGVPGESNPYGVFSAAKSKWQNINPTTPSLAKITMARMAGAKGLIIVNDFGNVTIEDQAARRSRSSFSTMLSMRRPRPMEGGFPVVVVSTAMANSLLASSGHTLEQLRQKIDSSLRPASFDIGDLTCTITTGNTIDSVSTENVIGRIEGSDPKLREETVIFSAHYDHLGVSSTGEVYNGADDDGSGTATVVALAEAFMKSVRKPKRSLLFLCVTGEEKGLLGSSYYVDHPVVDLKNTICDLNIDMIGRADTAYERRNETNYTFVIGSGRISKELDDILQEQNRKTLKLTLDYRYEGENDPERFYYRSDHYNFAKNGVPVIFFFTGTHADYHRPTDDFEKIDFENMSKIGSLIYHIGNEVANRPKRLMINTEKDVKITKGE